MTQKGDPYQSVQFFIRSKTGIFNVIVMTFKYSLHMCHHVSK